MDRDRGATAVQGAESRKGRIMGKLFGGRDRKVSNEHRGAPSGGDEIQAFLTASPAAPTSPTASRFPSANRASFDGFQVNHPAPPQPPQLAKLDTRTVSRYPNNSVPQSAGSQSSPSTRFPSKPPRPGARGMHVRFANSYPEIIGEGGDESEIPAMECGRRRHGVRSSPNPQAPPAQGHGPNATPEGNYTLAYRSTGSPSKQFQSPPAAQHHHLQQHPQHQPQSQSQYQQQQQQHNQPQHHQQQQQYQLQQLQQQTPPQRQYQPQTHRAAEPADDDFVPAPIRRTQTGYTSIPGGRPPRTQAVPQLAPPNQVIAERGVEADNINGFPSSQLAPATNDQRRSFIELQQAEMRQAEGRALANALRNRAVSPPSSPEPDEIDDSVPVSPISISPPKMTPPPALQPRHPRHVVPQPMLAHNATIGPESSPTIPPPAAAATPDSAPWGRPRQVAHSSSPPLALSPSTSVHRAFNALRQNATRQSPMRGHEDGDDSPISARSGESATSPRPMPALHDVVQSASDDTLRTFASRSRHLFELFRLQAETVRPLSTCDAVDLSRASLWWFLIGRMLLESSFRERSVQGSSAPVSRTNEAAMMQAYADLAKAYWIAGVILPDHPGAGPTEQARSVLLYSLRKLSVSMARNNIMPPEDVFLPQTIDKTIWIKYPSISSDIVALLWGNWASSLSSAHSMTPPMSVVECLPLNDSSDDFVFSRMKADVYLMEQTRDSNHPQQQFHLPCMLSVARPCTSALLEIVLASQSDLVQLRVRGKTNANGPSWDDVRWRSDAHSLELKLPRGLILAVQLTKTDFGLLWSMYDFGTKIQSLLYPRRDERPVFHSTLRSFQYFETGTPTGSFPKDAVPDCDVALFENVHQENAATGRRHFHRGFRIAVVSGTRTRTLYGITQNYMPDTPVQYDFLRGESGDPALFLRFENSRSKGNMVLSFAHGDERARFHSLLADTVVHNTERTSAEVPIMSLDVCLTAGATGAPQNGNSVLGAFKKLALKRLSIVNLDDEPDETTAPTVLSEHLKVVYEAANGTVVDRINVAPGELRIRLDVRCNTSLTIMRQAQKDLTVAISDMHVARELSQELANGLRVTSMAPTCRMLRFNALADLHAVQQAITGFQVLFDGVATSVLIARRRLVVPIHKKWETGPTRIQIVSHLDTKVVQLLAFFQDWHYGQSMSFVLKGTDVYEAFGRGSKTGIKFDDAKFPLPRMVAHDSDAGSGGGGSGGGGGSNGNITGSSESISAFTSGSGGDMGSIGSTMVSEAAFVCLDMPDLPGEHDDISIMFDKESERDRLAVCLPAPVRGSRMAKTKGR